MAGGKSQHLLELIIQAKDQTDAAFKAVAQRAQQLDQNFKKVGSSTQQATSGFQGLTRELSALPLGLGNIAAGLMAGVAGVFSIQAALQKLHATISEGLMLYSKAALNQVQLSKAWELSGRTLPIDAVNQYGDALEKSTNFSRSSITSAMKMLSVFPSVTGELLPKALQTAADLAAFKGIDIESAAQQIGRASTGMFTRDLRPYLSATTRQTKDFNSALNDLNRAFGGQAAIALDSYHGKLEKIDQQYTKLKKKIGEVLEPGFKIEAGAKLEWLEALNEQAKKSVEGGYLKQLQRQFQEITEALTSAPPAGENWLDEFLKGLASGLQATGEGIGRVFPPFEALIVSAKSLLSVWEEILGIRKKPETEPNLETDPIDRYIKALEAMHKGAREAVAGAEPVIDWKLEETKAQGHFDRLQQQMKTANEAEQAAIWSTAADKEEAERRITQAGWTYALQRIAAAQQEHDTILALKEKQWEKEKSEIKLLPTEGVNEETRIKNEAENAQKLMKLNEERTKGQIEAEKKLTGVISEEMTKRYDEIKKFEEQDREIRQKMQDSRVEAQASLDQIGAKAKTTYENLQVSIRRASEETQRAVDLLPTQPQKAMQLAEAARQKWVALSQDVKSLESQLRDVGKSYEDFFREMEKSKMVEPGQRFASDYREAARLAEEARAAQAAGDHELAQKRIQDAKNLAMATAREYQGSEFQPAAIRMVGEIGDIEKSITQTRIEEAKAVNQMAQEKIEKLNQLIESVWQQKLDENTAHLANLTTVLQLATEAIVKAMGPQGQPQPGEKPGAPGEKPPGTTAPPELTAAQAAWAQIRQEQGGTPVPTGATPSGIPWPTAPTRLPVTPAAAATGGGVDLLGMLGGMLPGGVRAAASELYDTGQAAFDRTAAILTKRVAKEDQKKASALFPAGTDLTQVDTFREKLRGKLPEDSFLGRQWGVNFGDVTKAFLPEVQKAIVPDTDFSFMFGEGKKAKGEDTLATGLERFNEIVEKLVKLPDQMQKVITKVDISVKKDGSAVATVGGGAYQGAY